MKRLLLTACALTLSLAACAPGLTTIPTSVPAAAEALRLPHLTVAGLVVTVHNPTGTPLTGDTSRGQRAVVTVVGQDITPAPGTTCTREVTAGLRWNCPVVTVEPGGQAPLIFVPDGTAPVITFAVGTGYLGSAVPVPLALLQR
ncbi:hypothetical protein [uncultured Deinococcus sp.]|uniref:hypothetical protein n=1 Tax=uncultured Deinococcus sp. TaxID=158789 RepID=UPI0025CFB1D1|nr:hypothetical protein [uncultured Deinococcus sp.]